MESLRALQYRDQELMLMLTVSLACGVKFARDCGEEGCVVGAILNFVSETSRGFIWVVGLYVVHFKCCVLIDIWALPPR